MSEEKIAVHCETEEEWEAVQEKAFKEGFLWPSGRHKSTAYPESNHIIFRKDTAFRKGAMEISHSDREWARGKGYTIIPASEYLEEAVEFSIEVYTTSELDIIRSHYSDLPSIGSGGYVYPTNVQVKNGTVTKDFGVLKKHYSFDEWQASTNQPKTTKKEESTMADIKESFITAFPKDTKLAAKMSARFGEQYDNTDRDILALERDKDDLVKILDAEEKAAEKAAKAKK
jgi:hypothetical protein